MKLTAAQKLEWIRITVYSVGDTITAAEALALIGSFFSADPLTRIPVGSITRINPTTLAPLAAELVTQSPKPRRRRARR